MTRRLITLVGMMLLGATVATAATLRVAAPRNHAVLHGGTSETLAWSAYELPAGSEEWEAFLSIDGGRYYAFRITPHLDIDRTEVTWTVPNVDAIDVRLMIRTGDEEHESTFELPQSFSIVRDPNAALPISSTPPSGHAEAARPGDPDVVAWADGDRTGERITVEYSPPACSSAAILAVAEVREGAPLVRPLGVRVRAAASIAAPVEVGARRRFIAGRETFPPADLLLLCRRRNI